MKSIHKSPRQIVYVMTLTLLLGVLVQCSTSQTDDKYSWDRQNNESDESPAVEHEYSLKSDRSALDELRDQVPEDRRRENDELALVLKDMAGDKTTPSKVRSKFNKVMRRKRNKFRKDMRRHRDNFRDQERERRDKFLEAQKDKREEFKERYKADRDEMNKFYNRIRAERKDFFAEQRERRKEFEEVARQKQKDFDAYLREKRRDFNEEHRAYSKRFYERKKANRLKKRMEKKKSKGSYLRRQGNRQTSQLDPESKKALEEFKKIPKSPGQQLGTDDQ